MAGETRILAVAPINFLALVADPAGPPSNRPDRRLMKISVVITIEGVVALYLLLRIIEGMG
jgi:hypothetical protein